MNKISDIRAKHLTSWNHHRCKFLPGDRAVVDKQVETGSYYSNVVRKRSGQSGKVVAVSCTKNGMIRENGDRQYTIYYIQFEDNTIAGIHSHALNKPILSPRELRFIELEKLSNEKYN